MAEKYPLVSNSSTLTIEELPIGDTLLADNLKVTGQATVEGDLTVIGNINANLGDVVIENLTVEGQTNLGLVGNVTITGGSNNYVLRTDGNGNLTWANIQSEIANAAGSNTYVQFNNNNLFGASPNFRFDTDTNTLYVDGTIQPLISNLGSVSNVHIDGGLPGQILATDGSGNLTWITDDNDPNIGDGGNANSELRLLAALDGGYANSVY
jgi:hypothetical protein